MDKMDDIDEVDEVDGRLAQPRCHMSSLVAIFLLSGRFGLPARREVLIQRRMRTPCGTLAVRLGCGRLAVGLRGPTYAL